MCIRDRDSGDTGQRLRSGMPFKGAPFVTPQEMESIRERAVSYTHLDVYKRQRHHIGGLFYQLPPIQGLAHAIQRTVRLGLLLLSIALGISFALHLPMTKTGHVVFAWIVWALYAVISLLMWKHFTSPRKTAWLAVIGFILPFISLWIVTHA